jgi:uncharacterized protein involved in type VI secretion and phage assembly
MIAMFDTKPDFQRSATGPGGTFYGVYSALVTDNQDPDNQGRVRIKLPWSPDTKDDQYELWARLSTPMAGNNRGTWFVPDVDDEVLVAFEAGNPRRPIVVGSLWNGSDSPPEQMDNNNTKKTILSREGVRLTMEDRTGASKMRLETPNGNTVVLDDGGRSITLNDNNGNTVKMDSSGVTVTAGAKVTVNAGTAEISTGMLKVSAGMSQFSGVVQCDTLITNSVVSASYTPGAGNIW